MAFGKSTNYLGPIVAILLVLAVIILQAVYGYYQIVGPAMNPTLADGDRVVINKVGYYFAAPQQGDIIVFKYPRDHSRAFIKRVIAVAGDTIEIHGDQIFVNGQLQSETYLLEPTRGIYPKQNVPDGHVFVLGDNRNNSEDSRFKDVGFVPYELIIGRVFYIAK